MHWQSMYVDVNNDTAIVVLTKSQTSIPASHYVLVCPAAPSCIPSKPFNTSLSPTSLFCQKLSRKGRKWTAMVRISCWCLRYFPFMTCLIHYHYSSGLPQQTTMTCFSVLKGFSVKAGTRTKRSGLFKLDENGVALLSEGSSHSCHIVQQQVNCWPGTFPLLSGEHC